MTLFLPSARQCALAPGLPLPLPSATSGMWLPLGPSLHTLVLNPLLPWRFAPIPMLGWPRPTPPLPRASSPRAPAPSSAAWPTLFPPRSILLQSCGRSCGVPLRASHPFADEVGPSPQSLRPSREQKTRRCAAGARPRRRRPTPLVQHELQTGLRRAGEASSRNRTMTFQCKQFHQHGRHIPERTRSTS